MVQKRMSKKGKKGFTLVEIIVVLVILAIMMAILIPSLTGYIDKAKQNTLQMEARAVLLAAQTLTSEKYARATAAGEDPQNPTLDEVLKLAEVSGTIIKVGVYEGRVIHFEYQNNGYSITYTRAETGNVPGAWSKVTKV